MFDELCRLNLWLPIYIYIYIYIYKEKIHFFGVVINLFLDVMTHSRCYKKKLFRCSYIASGEKRIYKKDLIFLLK